MAKESTSGDLFIDDFNISSLFTEKEDQDEVLEVDLFIDDFYLSVLFTEDEDQDEVVTISDAEYAEELQFQEALMGSMITSQMSNNPPPSSSTSNPEVPMEEAGKSSFSICEICVEDKESDEMFTNESCDHSFCTDCIGKHVATKIQENIQVVTCPGLDCKGVIEIDACRSVIPKEVLDRWDEAICESLILASQKFYCPFRDCSAMLVNDGVEVVRESECPICRRLFCAECNVPWHSGVECEEYQRLNEYERGREDLMVRELARDKKWMRCPHCKFFVEKTEGCLHITCRCGFQFCYVCGATWSQNHGGCQPQ